jgi:hypothetical protein
MYKSKFHVVEGFIQGYPCMIEPGQYGDFFVPFNVRNASALAAELKEERADALSHYTNDNLVVADPPFMLNNDLLYLRLKWKQQNVDNGEVVLVDADDKPLTGVSNQELQFAKLKLSFSMFSWEFKGKVGVKLQPRKIKLLEYGTINKMFTPEVEKELVGADF